jgi:hypothetical protein
LPPDQDETWFPGAGTGLVFHLPFGEKADFILQVEVTEDEIGLVREFLAQIPLILPRRDPLTVGVPWKSACQGMRFSIYLAKRI